MAQPAMFSWQQPLAALFGGISAAGQPGGWSNFGAGVNQTMQQQQSNAQNQQMMQLRQMQMQQAEEEMRRANQQEAQNAATIERLRTLGQAPGGPSPVRSVGNYGAATGGVQTASGQPAMFGGSPQVAAIFQGMLDAGDVQGALKFAAEQSIPDKPKASSEIGQIMADVESGFITPQQAQERIAKMNYIAPVGGASDGVWERYIDPDTGRMGQRNTKTGKIDFDPGNSMMAVVGHDANGNPIYDFVSGAPGPSKEFESKLANQSLLMGQGLDEIERLIETNNVSSLAVAGAETMANAGPLGEVLGQSLLLSPEDKQYMSARAAAMESLANTITGAAFTEQQKVNFMNMLPRPTDDDATVKTKLSKMRAYLKELETNAKVSNRRSGDDEDWQDVDGVQIRVKP